MTQIETLISIIESIDHDWLVEYIETNMWYITSDKEFLYWETDKGEYSGEIISGETRVGRYCLINFDNGCGETVTGIFDLREESSEKDLM